MITINLNRFLVVQLPMDTKRVFPLYVIFVLVNVQVDVLTIRVIER
jgi:hypothetical protein